MENRRIAVGIDLGTTYSAIAYIDEHGQPKIIPNDSNDRITPSVVFFENASNIIVGKEAKNELYNDPGHVVSFVKREMGKTKEEVRREYNNGEPLPYSFYAYNYSPEEISSFILKKLKKDAETYFNGQEIKDVVITVPAYFHDAERQATKNAGIMAGFNVLQIINEPTAAAYAYGVSNVADKSQNVFVFDLGGGTFDVTILQIEVNGANKSIHVLNTDGDHKLGGKDWDDLIIKHVSKLYSDEHDIDPREDRECMGSLTESVERAKISLSKKDSTRISVRPADGPPESFQITEDEFKKMSTGLLTKIEDLCGKVLREKNMVWADIDTILMAGGSTRMPMIVNLIEEISGKKVETNLVNPDECVAIGAAFLASKLVLESDTSGSLISKNLKEKLGNVSVKDILSHSLGNVILNYNHKEVNDILLKKGTPVPCETLKKYSTIENYQDKVWIQITEGESENPDNVNIIQDAILPVPNPKPELLPIHVNFSMNAEGLLTVTATEVTSNTNIVVQINKKDSLSAEEIQAMTRKVSSISVSG